MLTTRGRWFLITIGFLAFWSAWVFVIFQPIAALFSMSLLVWFAMEWTLFVLRLRLAAGKITIERTIVQLDRTVPNFWAKVPATVRVRIALKPGAWRLPFVAVADRVPVGQPIHGGLRRKVGALGPNEPIDLAYDLCPAAPGLALFEGVEVRFADTCGFFYHREFLRVPQEILVLPMLANEEGSQRSTKRMNTLPPPGQHRLRRAGGGSELLDLREYRPGDPPKTVAWKASARRDMLITKEFENDVPVRSTIFVDASTSMRLGDPGDTPLARTCGVAAAAAQAAAATRDLVGLVVFDEARSQKLKPARTRIHLMQMLRTFSETAALPADATVREIPMLQKLGLSLGRELYPDLMKKGINGWPLGFLWLLLLESKAKFWLLLPILFGYSLFTAWGLDSVIGIVRDIAMPDYPNVFVRFFYFTFGLTDDPLSNIIRFAIAFALVVAMPMTLAGFYWLVFGVRGFFGKRAKNMKERKQLGALFCTLDSDNPSALERYIHDDDFFRHRANQFLAAHRAVPPPEQYDEAGEYRFRGDSKLEVLCEAMVRAIGLAKDNELYLVVIDVVELADRLDPLLKAIRAARGRHHQVLVMVPWPEDVPTPDEHEAEAGQRGDRKFNLKFVVEQGLFDDYVEKFRKARTALARAGATVLRYDQHDAVRLILQRIEQLRTARIRR